MNFYGGVAQIATVISLWPPFLYFPYSASITVSFVVDDLVNHYKDTTITMVTGTPTA